MKRIGILTQYHNNQNLGAQLQAYALPVFLNSRNIPTQQISFDFSNMDKATQWKVRIILFPCYLKNFSVRQIYKKLLRLLPYKKEENPLLVKQSKIFKEFELFIPHSAQLYNNTNLTQAAKQYDKFIIGSDQVFSIYLLPLSAYYGEFTTPDKKVISYAASSNLKQFPSNIEKLFIKKLARFNAISVREKTLKDYIERITDKKVTVVLDPTFLLSPQEWLKIANPAPVPHKPYIFCYFLGGKSAWQRKIAQAYADKYGYEVVHLPYIMQSIRPADLFLKGQGRYDVGPREFIALINGAQCIFTDSFHGLAFSINFGKNFYVFNRDDQSGPDSMNARITDTLATFNLTTRHITDQNAILDNTPLDFTKAHEILAREKEFSINWLLNALKD